MQASQDYYTDGKFIKRGRLAQTFLNNSFTRYVFYILQSWLYFSLIFLNRVFNKSKKQYKYTICICGIFKNEARFLEEWIQYHLVVGVERFYLYNNNSDDNYYEVLKPFIDKGLVELIDWPMAQSQMDAYKDCYIKHRDDTNWLTFIDIDEFICPISTADIKTWLLGYRNYPGVAVYWKQFGSNGLLEHDRDKLVIEQYTQCWPKHSIFTKMFCNMDFPIHDFPDMHHLSSKIAGVVVPPINQYKKIVSMDINRCAMFGVSNIQINHYWGKAYDCFVRNKINRTDAYYADQVDMGNVRKRLLRSHEAMCTTKDYTIQRHLLQTKLKVTDQE